MRQYPLNAQVRSAMRNMLGLWPPAVRQLLERPAGAEEAPPWEGGEESTDDLALRKDMLLGHLLRLFAAKGGPISTAQSSDALPAVTSDLLARGLIPK